MKREAKYWVEQVQRAFEIANIDFRQNIITIVQTSDDVRVMGTNLPFDINNLLIIVDDNKK